MSKIVENFKLQKTKNLSTLHDKFVPPENRYSSNVMTKFEKSSVIAALSEDIANGRVVTNKITENYKNKFQTNTDMYMDLAIQLIKNKKCPYAVVRPCPDKNRLEWWDVNELIIYF